MKSPDADRQFSGEATLPCLVSCTKDGKPRAHLVAPGKDLGPDITYQMQAKDLHEFWMQCQQAGKSRQRVLSAFVVGVHWTGVTLHHVALDEEVTPVLDQFAMRLKMPGDAFLDVTLLADEEDFARCYEHALMKEALLQASQPADDSPA